MILIFSTDRPNYIVNYAKDIAVKNNRSSASACYINIEGKKQSKVFKVKKQIMRKTNFLN